MSKEYLFKEVKCRFVDLPKQLSTYFRDGYEIHTIIPEMRAGLLGERIYQIILVRGL